MSDENLEKGIIKDGYINFGGRKASYMVCINVSDIDYVFNSTDDEEFSYYDYEFRNTKLDDLAILAKDDESALNELLNRLSFSIDCSVKKFLQTRSYLNYSELSNYIYNTIYKCFRNYDVNLGPFVAYFRSLLLRAEKYFEIDKAKELKKMEERYVPYNDQVAIFADSSSLQTYEINLASRHYDIKEIIKNLPRNDQQILTLLITLGNVGEVAKVYNVPAQTIYNRLKKIKEKINSILKNK